MYERMAIPIYWDLSNYSHTKLKNWEQFNSEYLSNGWEIERVDELHSELSTVLMYIIRKEKKEES